MTPKQEQFNHQMRRILRGVEVSKDYAWQAVKAFQAGALTNEQATSKLATELRDARLGVRELAAHLEEHAPGSVEFDCVSSALSIAENHLRETQRAVRVFEFKASPTQDTMKAALGWYSDSDLENVK